MIKLVGGQDLKRHAKHQWRSCYGPGNIPELIRHCAFLEENKGLRDGQGSGAMTAPQIKIRFFRSSPFPKPPNTMQPQLRWTKDWQRNLLSKCTTHSISNFTEVKTLKECRANAIILTDSKWICFVKSKLRKSL